MLLLLWKSFIVGVGISQDDINNGGLQGSFQIGNTGSFSFNHNFKEDNKTEGQEIYEIRLFSDANRTNQVAFKSVEITTLWPNCSRNSL